MSFKGNVVRNTEMSEDRVNGIISELIEKTKLLAEELRNSNRIATELMSANTQLRSEYSILKNKFLQFLNEDDLQDYIDNSNAYSHPSNSKLNQELEGLSQNKRALEIECTKLTQELNECKSRLAQQEKQAKSYAILQDITANKDQEINNLQLQLQLLTTQLQSDTVKKQSSNINTKLSMATAQSPSDASQRQYSSSKQDYLQYTSQQQAIRQEQQFQYSKSNQQQQPQYPLQIIPNMPRNQNTNSNPDLEHDNNNNNNNSNLDGSSNEEIPGEVDIQNINKKTPVLVQQDRQYRAQSVSSNYELINEKPKKVAHQQSQSILPTSNTTIPLSTTNRTNKSPLHQQQISNPGTIQQNNNSNIPLKNSNNSNQNMNNNLKKIRGILDHSESQPVIRSKTPNTAPYYARNFVANDFNELLYAEQPHKEEQDYAQEPFTKNSNNFNNTDHLQFSNAIEQSNFNTQPNFFNSNFSDTKKQTGIQQLNYPPGNNFHNTVSAKQTYLRPPQMVKDPYPYEQSNEKQNPTQNYSNFERQNMNKNYESQPSSNSPYNNNSNNLNDRLRQDDNLRQQQQFIDPYKNSQQTIQQKSNNNSAAFDLQQVAQKNTRSGFLKKQQGATRNSSVTANKWK